MFDPNKHRAGRGLGWWARNATRFTELGKVLYRIGVEF
jgi:hypothetical protein